MGSPCPPLHLQAGTARHDDLLRKFRFTEALEMALATHRQEVRVRGETTRRRGRAWFCSAAPAAARRSLVKE